MSLSHFDRTYGPPIDEAVILSEYVLGSLASHPPLVGKVGLSRSVVGTDYRSELMVLGHHGLPHVMLSPSADQAETRLAIERMISQSPSPADLAPRSVEEERVISVLAPLCRGVGKPGFSSIVWTHLFRLLHEDGHPLEGPEVLEQSVDLFRRECDRLRPKRLLVLAGWNAFAPFARAMSFMPLGSGGQFAEVVGRIGGCLAIVLNNPCDPSVPDFVRVARRWLSPSDELMSEAQQSAFERMCGYPWDGHTSEGRFVTDYGDRGREDPPSGDMFEYCLRESTGCLFMSLSSRWWGAESVGLDRRGAALPREMTLRMFPEHL